MAEEETRPDTISIAIDLEDPEYVRKMAEWAKFMESQQGAGSYDTAVRITQTIPKKYDEAYVNDMRLRIAQMHEQHLKVMRSYDEKITELQDEVRDLRAELDRQRRVARVAEAQEGIARARQEAAEKKLQQIVVPKPATPRVVRRKT